MLHAAQSAVTLRRAEVAIINIMIRRSVIALILCLSSNVSLGTAFIPAAGMAKKAAVSNTAILSSDYEQQYDDGSGGNPEEQQQMYQYNEGEETQQYIQEEQQSQVPQQIPQQPPAPRGQRLDPLLASLTRQDPTISNTPMTTVPFFGEVPADAVKILAPIAVFTVVGFLYSIFVTLTSGDELARVLLQVTNDIADKASAQPNQVYDPNVCRGICTPDQSGLKSFMESLRK